MLGMIETCWFGNIEPFTEPGQVQTGHLGPGPDQHPRGAEVQNTFSKRPFRDDSIHRVIILIITY